MAGLVRPVLAALFVVALLLGPTGCDGSTTPEPEPLQPVPTKLRLKQDTVAFTWLGQVKQAGAWVLDQRGNTLPDDSLVWRSSDVAVATVDADGKITSRQNGSSQLIVTRRALADTSLILIQQVPDSIEVTPSAIRFGALGDTARARARVLDEGGALITAARPSWAVGDGTLAKVDSTGLVTSLNVGTTSVSARVGSVSGASALQIAQDAKTVKLTADTLRFASLAGSSRLLASVSDARGNPIPAAPVMWSSSAPSIASVDGSGQVRPVGNGTAIVTATAGDATARTVVIVRQVPASLLVSPDSAVLFSVGTKRVFTAVARDASGVSIADADIAWSTNQGAVIRVEPGGSVTGLNVGSGFVDATSGSATARAAVTVRSPAGTTKIWTGAVSTSWQDDANWSPSGVPTYRDSIYVTGSRFPRLQANAEVGAVTQAAATTIDLNGFDLSVYHLDGSAVLIGSGRVVPGGLYAGSIPALYGSATLAGNLIVRDSVQGTLRPNGHHAFVGGNLLGGVQMVNPADTVTVNGNAGSYGPTRSVFGGQMDAGVLRLRGDVFSWGDLAPCRFCAQGSHLTVFDGDRQQNVDLSHRSGLNYLANVLVLNPVGAVFMQNIASRTGPDYDSYRTVTVTGTLTVAGRLVVNGPLLVVNRLVLLPGSSASGDISCTTLVNQGGTLQTRYDCH